MFTSSDNLNIKNFCCLSSLDLGTDAGVLEYSEAKLQFLRSKNKVYYIIV